jgi:hypothetical protein
MRAREITTENKKSHLGKKINEAPVGVGQRLGTWARGKAAGALGPLARDWQAQISGEKEVNDYANKLNIAFRKALGIKKVNPNDPAAIDLLYNWAKGSGLPVTDPEVEQKFQAAKTASANIKTGGSGVPATTSAGAATPAGSTNTTASSGSSSNVDWTPGRKEPTFNIPKAATAPEKGVPTPPTIDPKAAAQIKPTTNNAVSITQPDPNWNFATRRDWQKQQDDEKEANSTRSAKINAAGLKRSKQFNAEDIIQEDKKTLEQLIYALADATLSKGISTGTPAGATSAATPATTDVDQIANLVGNMSGKDLAALKQKLKGVI